MQEPLVTNDDLQKQFDDAAKAGVSPCAWLPPEWSALEKNKYKFFNTVDGADLVTAVGKFDNNTAAEDRLNKGKNADGKLLHKPDSVPDEHNKGWVDPFSDFTHIDNSEFPVKDLNAVANQLEANSIANPAVKLENEAILKRLKRLVGSDTPGMKRLGRVFEWVLYRTTDLLGSLNVEAKANNQTAYDDARKNYIEFLKDLDDHEPERKTQKMEPQSDLLDEMGKNRTKLRKSGYGRTIKWTCLSPVIFGGKIYGARVIVHWNPHSSSNGIPIKHP